MKKTLTFLLILFSIIGFSQTKPTDSGFKSLITPRAVTFWWDAANSDPWMQSSYLGTAPNTWVKLWTATKTQVKLDSLANAKQDTLTLTTTGTGAATLIGSTLNIPISSGILPDSLKEDKANKENTTVSNDTIKYPTVNLLKTYADTKAPLFSGTTGFIPIFTSSNTINNSILFSNGTKIGVNNSSLEYDLQVGSGENSGYNTVGIDASVGIPSIYFGKLGSYLGYDYAGNERMILNSRYINSHYEFRINDIEKIRIESNGDLKIINLSSTNPEILSHSPDGTITKITDGTNGQFLKTNGAGGYTFSTLPIASSTVTGTVKVDGTTIVSTGGVISVSTAGTGWNHSYQPLSGTTITYDVSIGINAILTLSGNTTVNMSNVQAGMVGDMTIINDATIRTITFSGYTFNISLSIKNASNSAYSSGNTNIDSFTWSYDGTRIKITGEYNLQ